MVRPVICAALLMIFNQQSYAQLWNAGPPAPANIPGYHKAHCVSLTREIRICKGLSDSENEFMLEKDGTRIGTWPGRTYVGETSDFEVLLGDLDGDGLSDLIVANRDSTSTGIGVNVWTIAILASATLAAFDLRLHSVLRNTVQPERSFGTAGNGKS